MLFFNVRARHTAAATAHVRQQTYSYKISQMCVVFGSFLIVIGLIIVVVGVIYEVNTTKYAGIGVICLGVTFYVISLLFCYAKLDICYNNFIYRSRVLPTTNDISPVQHDPVVPTAHHIKLPNMLQTQQQITTISEIPSHHARTSNNEIHKVLVVETLKDMVTIDSSNNQS